MLEFYVAWEIDDMANKLKPKLPSRKILGGIFFPRAGRQFSQGATMWHLPSLPGVFYFKEDYDGKIDCGGSRGRQGIDLRRQGILLPGTLFFGTMLFFKLKDLRRAI